MKDTKRIPSLDAVRGYAALTVLLAHTTVAGLYNNPTIWPYLEWSPFRFLWAGHQAVIVFFVLSGFALTMMINSANPFNMFRYLLARVARLYIPFIASLLFVAIVFAVMKSSGFSWEKGWMGVAKPDFNLATIVNHIGMLGFYNYFEINPPAWSLVYEARISIAFPLILYFTKKLGFRFVLLSLLASMLSIFIMNSKPHLYGIDPLSSSLLTVHYSLFFTIGAYLALNVKRTNEIMNNIDKKIIFLLVIISLMLYCYPFNNGWTLSHRGLGDIVTSIGAVGLIVCSLKLKEGKFLSVGLYLGRISFSLYLIHYTILSIGLLLLYKYSPIYVWVFTIPTSIIIAHLFTKLIDNPSISLSRLMYGRKTKSISISQAR
ncbi:acyltransferase [Escherichia coli]|uniref:acyltransferase family protein n=1 Tax=Escherichia coli TaxID=562 RepID=UPI0015DDED3F|nr:acyltransferase [Escherichia coli]EFG4206342.1 acyltransferase [Escherichia coli]EFK1934164.1 acyltransferase [Escherichia coli]ELH3081520.1 acyltransferase [Escherichia coli]MDA6765412.1 acyltransferase [Escherichia coli]NZC86611.1 acyltransferase [Escherichia coli]